MLTLNSGLYLKYKQHLKKNYSHISDCSELYLKYKQHLKRIIPVSVTAHNKGKVLETYLENVVFNSHTPPCH